MDDINCLDSMAITTNNQFGILIERLYDLTINIIVHGNRHYLYVEMTF